MALPEDPKPIHVQRAVDYVERETAELVDLYFEQAKDSAPPNKIKP